jgi:hypothetical protein
MNVPQEIRDRFEAGEREIVVSPQLYQEYCDGLMWLYRRTPNEHADRSKRFVWYKNAKVVLGDASIA